MSKQTGTVKWFNQAKGYGFLRPESGGADVFVHMTDLKKSGLTSLQDGAKVSYVLADDQRTGKTVAKELEVEHG